jgi:hypothetical protein
MWTLAALLGLVLTAGVTWATSRLTSQHIGISSEPISAGARLAPPTAERTARRRSSRTGRASKAKPRVATSQGSSGLSQSTPAEQTPPSSQSAPVEQSPPGGQSTYAAPQRAAPATGTGHTYGSRTGSSGDDHTDRGGSEGGGSEGAGRERGGESESPASRESGHRLGRDD